MELKKFNLRAFIKTIINEGININEAQKGDRVDLNIDNWVNNLEIFEPAGKYDINQIRKEVKKAIDIKINSVMRQNFKFADFIVIPLGDFKIKTNEGDEALIFKKSSEKYNSSFPYIFVYQDSIQVFRFGSRMFTELDKEAASYIKQQGINLNTLSETGNKVVTDNHFDTTNYIDMVDWSKVNRPEPEKREPRLAKEKRSYRPGQKFNHAKYGKGEIQFSKKIGADEYGNEIYDVTVMFDLTPEQRKMFNNPINSEKEKRDIMVREMKRNTKVIRMKKKLPA
jgi:hypothetical protein